MTAEELYYNYITLNKSLCEMASLLNISKSSVKRLLDKEDIHKDKGQVYKDRKSPILNKKQYNNGERIIYLSNTDTIPDGYIQGGLAVRSHESYVEAGKKSSATQKAFWENADEQFLSQWKTKMQQSHTTEGYVCLGNIASVEKRRQMSEEEKAVQDKKRSDSLKKYWESLSQEEKDALTVKKKLAGACWNKQTISKTNLEKYGVQNQFQRTDVQWNYNHSNSKPNLEFARLLEENGIEYEREFPLGKYSYDFKVGNTLVEIDPTATHNSTWSPFGEHNGIDKNYHLDKTNTAKLNGYRCVHVFDWDNVLSVINTLKDREILQARKCILQYIDKDTASSFLALNHIQGYAKDEVRLGLYYESRLVSVMTFGKPRYNKRYQWELVRMCSTCYIKGGYNKMLKKFLSDYNVESVVSYCDFAKFNGTSYNELGFTLNKLNKPSKHWYNIATKRHITDNLLRQRGFDQLMSESAGKGTNNADLMRCSGYVEVYDCGQARFVLINKD